MKTISATISNFGTAKDLTRARVKDYHESYNFGNEQLYDLCRKHPLGKMVICPSEQDSKLTEDEAAFADEMWLIGRAYAASPQRYVYKDGLTKPSEDYLSHEGYESFFADIARILFRGPYNRDNGKRSPRAYLRGKECILDFDLNEAESVKIACETLYDETKPFIEAFSKLSDKQYRCEIQGKKSGEVEVTISEHDFRLLRQTISCVVQFSKLISSARLLRDAAILKQSCTKDADDIRSAQQRRWSKRRDKNKPNKSPQKVWEETKAEWEKTMNEGKQSLCLSFSSKFLHFHCPQLFFIYDSISSNNIGNLGTQINLSLDPKDGNSIDNAGVSIHLNAPRNSVYLALNEALGQDTDDDEKKYVVHACKELIFAYLVHDAVENDPRPITRLVDFLITNAVKLSD